MQDLVTPETLDQLDRRVYDLAIQPIPLAEIAVRLGVPVGQADERVQRVCARLGVADRAGLRAWRPAGAEVKETPEDGAEVSDDATPRAHSRRAFVIASSVVALAAVSGAAAVALAFRGGGSKQSAEPPASESPSPGATGDAADGLTRVSKADTWEVVNFSKGELIDWPHGLFLMGVAGGEVRGHRLRTTDAINYQTWGQGRFVAGEQQVDGLTTVHLADILNTETSWSWSSEKLRLLGVVGNLPEATLIFEEVEERQGTGNLIALRAPKPGADLELLGRESVPPTGFEANMLVSSDQSAVAVVSTTDRLAVTVLDGKLGHHLRLDGAKIPNTRMSIRELKDVSGADGEPDFLVSYFRYDSATGVPFEEQVIVLPWNDGQGLTAANGTDRAATFSTDGGYYLREIPLRNVTSEGADGPREYWPAVEIVETSTGKVAQRIRSAAIYYGDWNAPNRWSSDTWFLTLIRSEQSEDGWDVARFVPSPKKAGWEILNRFALSTEPDFDGTWYESPWVQGIVPSPTNPDLLAVGKFSAVDLRMQTFVKANVRNAAGPAHIDPWAAGSNWLTFAFPHLGHGGASPPVLLQPKFEPADSPIDGPLRFKVASRRAYPPPPPSLPGQGPYPQSTPATSDRLNLRGEPSRAAPVLASLENGTALLLADSPDARRPLGRKSVEKAADGTWIYVRTDGGLEGWVSSAYVEWA